MMLSVDLFVLGGNSKAPNCIQADLLNENTREAALLGLRKKREQVSELALILWHSFDERYPTAFEAAGRMCWRLWHFAIAC